MRVEVGGLGSAEVYLVVGDGARGIRVLKPLAARFNHCRTVRAPQAPIRGKGLEATFNTLTVLVDKTRVSKYLILIDREHIADPGSVEAELRRRGFDVTEMDMAPEGLIRILARRGHKEVAVFVAVLGLRKSIEEHLARLIEALYGDRVEPEKSSVNSWLRSKGLSKGELVEEALKRGVAGDVFPQLVKALETLSKDP